MKRSGDKSKDEKRRIGKKLSRGKDRAGGRGGGNRKSKRGKGAKMRGKRSRLQ